MLPRSNALSERLAESTSARDQPNVWADAWSFLRRNRDFRLFYIGQLVSYAGDWFLIVALSGLVLRLTHSDALVAAVCVAY
ncbi:MAG: hypothetical protein ACXVPX_08215, partial [Actinomycetota bacterium]